MPNETPPHRPPLYDESMQTKDIRMPTHLIQHARAVGDGNMSAGVRACIERDLQRHSGSTVRAVIQSGGELRYDPASDCGRLYSRTGHIVARLTGDEVEDATADLTGDEVNAVITVMDGAYADDV